MTALTHALLRDYADTFRTYGSLEGRKVWFLGLEEGGGANLEEAGRKLSQWHEHGRESSIGLTAPELDEAHRDSRFLSSAHGPVKLQTTWANQLRVWLGMRGEPLDNEVIRRLQASEHGQMDGPTCLMELFPLPCRKDGAWIYAQVPDNPSATGPNVFASKKGYREHYLPRRLAKLAELVREHRPLALVCTGLTYGERVLESLGVKDCETPDLGLPETERRAKIGYVGDTVVAVCSHPAQRAKGPTNEFYHRLGRAIADRAVHDEVPAKAA